MKKIVFLFFILSESAFSQITLNNLEILRFNSIIEFQNNLWVFGPGRGYYKNPTKYNALKSTDNGNTWNIAIPGNGTLHEYAKTVLFKNTLYSIGGHVGSTFVNDVKTSTDGLNWNTYTAPFSGRKSHGVLVHNNKLFVVAGLGNGNRGLNDVWFTENGTDWTRATNNLSADFPHFVRPKVVSLNGKLILFGGDKSDWGFESNTRGVYVSADDGYNWTRYQCPFEIDLNYDALNFIHNNKLYCRARINNYHNIPNTKTLHNSEDAFFTTTNGIDWEIEPDSFLDSVREASVIETKVVHYGNLIYVYTTLHTRLNSVTKRMRFDPPGFRLTPVGSIIKKSNIVKKVMQSQTTNIPFTISHTDPHFNGKYTYCFRSSVSEVVNPSDISISENQLQISSTGTIGETLITIIVSDGTNEHQEQFYYFTFPNADVYIRKIENRCIAPGSSGSIIIYYQSLPAYGTNNYTVSSSNTNFIAPEDIVISQHNFFKKVFYVDFNNFGSVLGETEISIKATDGNTSYTSSFWLKTGTNQMPVIAEALENYQWNRTTPFAYDLPANAFSDPDNENLTYSSGDLPCGLSINKETGKIAGMTEKNLPFTLTINAKDKYGGSISQMLKVLGRNLPLRPDTAPPTFGDATVENQTYTVGTAITTLELPVATGGNGAITYSLTGTLPDGLMWNEGTSPQTIAGEPTTAAAVDFTYTAADTDSNDDDTATLQFTITVEAPPITGIDDLTDAAFNIYPNPVSGSLTVERKREGDEIRIYDFTGKRIQVPVREQSPRKVVLDVSGIPGGMYLMKAGGSGSNGVRVLVGMQ